MAPRSNEASVVIRSGRMAEVNKTLDELTNPEAQYFCTEGGTPTGYLFFDCPRPGCVARPGVAQLRTRREHVFTAAGSGQGGNRLFGGIQAA